ncbi:hypothetical protein RND71_031216 [Anisodus tanguticus]|uniref:Uncharacterized protein n=1 Tax=Anisodus tanguticus TaxID=243964 RepID=A0AAE1V2Y9_9SOLA|nr:hypothetical protein RND71_031216 [Anisodus tanguticus]
MNASDQHLLTSEVLKLAFRLVHLYIELRQVNLGIFTLSKVVREVVYSVANSLSMLLCSPEFRLSIRNAVKSIPGGQASGCIRELIVDVAESLKWIKSEYQLLAESDSAEPRSSSCDMLFFDLKAEILGKSMTELYTLILYSMTSTTSNSNLVALSVKDFMAVIRPEHSVRQMHLRMTFAQYAGLWSFSFIYICLVEAAKDWLERISWEDENYFSCIVQPSTPIPAVLHIIAEFCHQQTVID